MNKRYFLPIAATLLLSVRLAAGQAQPPQPPAASGRLGGGYKSAKWGMSIAEVKKKLPSHLEYETRQPKVDKILILDLGEGRKVTCYFENDRFYQAIYQPVAADNDQQAAEAVLAGLEKKYGPGKDEEGFTDKGGKPLKLITWNDGISKIEFRMRDPKAPEKTSDRKPPPYPSSTLAVIYTDIASNAKRTQRQEAERKRLEDLQHQQKINDIQGDL
jgi:hypothetical protein